jgi:hypothetical protein
LKDNPPHLERRQIEQAQFAEERFTGRVISEASAGRLDELGEVA